MLHVTSGDAAVERLRQSGITGYMLPWRDILHEGPVAAGISLQELREVRARFIEKQGWGVFEIVSQEMRRRDETLAGFRQHEEVVLWFEPDLLSQLQMIQALDVLAGRPLGATRLTRVEAYAALARTGPDTIRGLFEGRMEVPEPERDLARRAWEAFRAPEPSPIAGLLKESPAVLPHVHAALHRHLQEYPSLSDGLARSERQILRAVADGVVVLQETYVAGHQEKEERAYFGDRVFGTCVERLSSGSNPAIVLAAGGSVRAPRRVEEEEPFWKGRVRLTDLGYSLIEGKVDWIKINGADRWLGGVFLLGQTIAWRWNDAKQQIQRTGFIG